MDFAAFLSNLGNNLGFGLTVTLIGIAIVFLGLTILIGLIKPVSYTHLTLPTKLEV